MSAIEYARCEWCGEPAKKSEGLCLKCQRKYWRSGTDARAFTPSIDYRDLLSKQTRDRLESWEGERKDQHERG